MPRITINLPEEIARRTTRLAKQAGKSVSAYIADIVARQISGAAWPEDLIDLLNRGHGDLVEPPDPPPEETQQLG
jgi:predicted transcriptional regulator